jgi:hypothetical protein
MAQICFDIEQNEMMYVAKSVVLKLKCWGSLACRSRLKEMCMNHDKRPLSLLLNDSCTHLSAEMNDK